MPRARGPAARARTLCALWRRTEPRQGPSDPHLVRASSRFSLRVLLRRFTPASHATPLTAIPTRGSWAGRRPGLSLNQARCVKTCSSRAQSHRRRGRAHARFTETAPPRRCASSDRDDAGHRPQGSQRAGQRPAPRLQPIPMTESTAKAAAGRARVPEPRACLAAACLREEGTGPARGLSAAPSHAGRDGTRALVWARQLKVTKGEDC